MATVTYIPEHTQSKAAMGKVMRYCSREDKTRSEQDGREFQLISGKDCCGDTAFKEFMATKQQYGKAHGMFFYQYVQSFSPEEHITPQQAHEIGCKFAEYFKGHEVLVTTHTDKDHCHTHLVINSVNFENGKKLQMARGSIYDLRKFSDDICREYNLSIVVPKEQGLKNIRAREYRAADNHNSWKFKLMNMVDAAMEQSRTKAEFIAKMRSIGYDVSWSDSRKHITYTTPDGMKCRDNKMHDDKYLKENMEAYYEYGAVKGVQQAGKSERELQLDPSVLRSAAGDIGAVVDHAGGNRTGHGAHAGGSRTASDVAGLEGATIPSNAEVGANPDRPYRKLDQGDNAGAPAAYGGADGRGQKGDWGQDQTFRGNTESAGLVPAQGPPDMDGLGSVGADDIIRIAHHIESLVNPRDPEKEREERDRKRELRIQERKHQKSHGWDMEL